MRTNQNNYLEEFIEYINKMDNVIEYLLEHKEINENEFLEQFNKVK